MCAKEYANRADPPDPPFDALRPDYTSLFARLTADAFLAGDLEAVFCVFF